MGSEALAYHVRPPRPDETPRIEEVVKAAFGESGTEVANLVVHLRTLWTAGRGFELVAAGADGVIGHIGFSRGYLDARDRLRYVLVLSPLAVRPDLQHQGVGSALVRAGLDQAAKEGFDLVFLEGAPRLYPRLGFVPGGEAGFIKPSVRIPDPAFQVFYLTPAGKSLSGALVYPEAFWETDCVGLRD